MGPWIMRTYGRNNGFVQKSIARRTGKTAAKLAGVRGTSNRTNLPPQRELLSWGNGPGSVPRANGFVSNA
jgi:hypothetical protein